MPLLLSFDPFRNLHTYLWIGVTIFGVVGYIAHEIKLRAGQVWPIVNGTVESTGIVQAGNRLQVEIHYSYGVNGEYFSGLYFRPVFTTKKGEAILDAIPRGTGVLVHYKPDAFDVSVLDRHQIQSLIDAAPILTA